MTIQSTIAITGITLGAVYVIGAFIVNTYLAKFGLQEYSILRVKFLAVGLNYLFNLSYRIILALLLISIILIFNKDTIRLIIITISISSLFMISYIVLVMKDINLSLLNRDWTYPVRYFFSTMSLLGPLLFFSEFLISSIFPSSEYSKFFLTSALRSNGKSISFTVGEVSFFVIMIVFLITVILFDMIFYALRLYGNLSPNVERTPTGAGIPTLINLSGDNLQSMERLGVPVSENQTVNDILLIDETDKDLILGINIKNQIKAVKASKTLVKNIFYIRRITESEFLGLVRNNNSEEHPPA